MGTLGSPTRELGEPKGARNAAMMTGAAVNLLPIARHFILTAKSQTVGNIAHWCLF